MADLSSQTGGGGENERVLSLLPQLPSALAASVPMVENVGGGADIIDLAAFRAFANVMEPTGLSASIAEVSGVGNVYQGDTMADQTREEIDAKLSTIEARTETRFVELSGKIDRVVDSINALTSAVTTVRIEVKEDGKFTRWTVGVTIIASVIAFAAALWVTQGNLLSAFQAGLLLKSEQVVAPSPSAPRSPSNR